MKNTRRGGYIRNEVKEAIVAEVGNEEKGVEETEEENEEEGIGEPEEKKQLREERIAFFKQICKSLS